MLTETQANIVLIIDYHLRKSRRQKLQRSIVDGSTLTIQRELLQANRFLHADLFSSQANTEIECRSEQMSLVQTIKDVNKEARKRKRRENIMNKLKNLWQRKE